MTLKDLQNKVSVSLIGRGTFRVMIDYRGKMYKCYSNNSLAWDDLHTDFANERVYYKTEKQCLQAFWDECKQNNNLA